MIIKGRPGIGFNGCQPSLIISTLRKSGVNLNGCGDGPASSESKTDMVVIRFGLSGKIGVKAISLMGRPGSSPSPLGASVTRHRDRSRARKGRPVTGLNHLNPYHLGCDILFHFSGSYRNMMIYKDI